MTHGRFSRLYTLFLELGRSTDRVHDRFQRASQYTARVDLVIQVLLGIIRLDFAMLSVATIRGQGKTTYEISILRAQADAIDDTLMCRVSNRSASKNVVSPAHMSLVSDLDVDRDRSTQRPTRHLVPFPRNFRDATT